MKPTLHFPQSSTSPVRERRLLLPAIVPAAAPRLRTLEVPGTGGSSLGPVAASSESAPISASLFLSCALHAALIAGLAWHGPRLAALSPEAGNDAEATPSLNVQTVPETVVADTSDLPEVVEPPTPVPPRPAEPTPTEPQIAERALPSFPAPSDPAPADKSLPVLAFVTVEAFSGYPPGGAIPPPPVEEADPDSDSDLLAVADTPTEPTAKSPPPEPRPKPEKKKSKPPTRRSRPPSTSGGRAGPKPSIGGKTTSARLRVSVAARYPATAKRQGVEGQCLVEVTIGANGKVSSVRLVRGSGDSRLDKESLRAARASRFHPALRNGQKVGATVRMPFRFVMR